MKKVLIRLEDVGPGGEFGTEERLLKLCAVADLLAREGVPFHVAMIPRFVDKGKGYDKSIADRNDPFVRKFLQVISYLRARGGSIGMHGYRHQYQTEPSAAGYEFYYSACESDCPPQESDAAYLERDAFESSYSSSRMREGFQAAKQAGVQLDWFETPHYAAEGNARNVLEGWAGLFFENDPRHEEANRKVLFEDLDSPLYRGVVYVPTPLFYVDGSHPDQDVERMCKEIAEYGADEIAGFFYHAFLEFPFMELQTAKDGRPRVKYDPNSYLHRLLRCFKRQERTFVHVKDLVPFAPSARRTGVFPGNHAVVLTGDVDGDRRSELVLWEPESGTWSVLRVNLDGYPNRNVPIGEPLQALTGWAQGESWRPFLGDVNGDGRADLIVLDTEIGQWQAALSDGAKFVPAAGDRQFLWLENFAAGPDWLPLVGDFNGDGKTDAAAYRLASGDLRVAQSTGAHFAEVLVPNSALADEAAGGRKEGRERRVDTMIPHLWIKGWVSGTDWTVAAGDFNGDGRTDLVAWNRRTGDWKVALSNGKRLIPTAGPVGPYWRRGFGIGTQWRLLVADFDGDGRDDVLLVDPVKGIWLAAQNRGSRFVPHETPFGPWAAGSYGQPFAGVFTTDGKAAIGVRQAFLRSGVVDFAVSLQAHNKK
ncbi:DUF2334 domain-containing protein [Tumebacillus flagellatus]|uniref:DUF2334 domain-containing protein n=1 Tax=Tumebacillus flagellatus TaxID=1157490 RepID=A0A074LK52_9BACL|nr:DUF2334 domain-containing protein [Tumebacillus flagellatus]KEO82531.1 hypothetical protein EL26_14960 [Tumebacillus flagellatus]